MTDIRVRNHARLLVNYCIGAKSRQTVGVTGTTEAQSLIIAVHEELMRTGAHPAIRMNPPGFMDALFRFGRKVHFTTASPFAEAYAEVVDSTIGIQSSGNTRELNNVDPGRQVELARAQRKIAKMLRGKPWVLTLHPTTAYAQEAGMSLNEFEDFVYSAMFADEEDPIAAWNDMRKKQQKLVSRLRGADVVRIVGAGTDVRMSVNGRRFVNSDGHRNMPSGEIFAAPVEGSIDGVICFDIPVCRDGREIEGVRLVFKNGQVVEATAEKNQGYLLAMLKTDAGAKCVGELGIGTNHRITRPVKNILFDEKIGGTIHIAIGDAPLQTGGKNRSAIHWDLIKDLRKEGAIYVDGRKFRAGV